MPAGGSEWTLGGSVIGDGTIDLGITTLGDYLAIVTSEGPGGTTCGTVVPFRVTDATAEYEAQYRVVAERAFPGQSERRWILERIERPINPK
jgi:hypothetical protein